MERGQPLCVKSPGFPSLRLVSLSCWNHGLPRKVRAEVAAAGRARGSSCLVSITLAKFFCPLRILQMVMMDWKEPEQLVLLHTPRQQVTGFGVLPCGCAAAVMNQTWLAQQHMKLGWAANTLAFDVGGQGTDSLLTGPLQLYVMICPLPAGI